jgi:outer membrane protein OmpA-like peptidoglycan-associated protein
MHFTIVGFGAQNPVAPNRKPDGSDDPEGRQRNRRVTFIIPK